MIDILVFLLVVFLYFAVFAWLVSKALDLFSDIIIEKIAEKVKRK